MDATWRLERPEATTMKSAIGLFPDTSIATMSSALSASRDLRMKSSSLRLCGDASDLIRGFAAFFEAGFAVAAFLAADLLASLLASALRAATLPAGVLLAADLLVEALRDAVLDAGVLLAVDEARELRAGRFVDRVCLLGSTGYSGHGC